MSRRLPLHPLLFALFPILALAARNAEQVLLDATVVRMAGIVLVVAAVLLLALRLVLRDARRGALLASFVVLWFFSYGHASSVALACAGSLPQSCVLAAWGVVLLLGAGALLRVRGDLGNATAVANVVALSLVVLPGLQLGACGLRRAGYHVELPGAALAAQAANARGPRPDVYYIILDRYASAASLREFYRLDNSGFVGSLAQRGFYVASRSHSNYPKTAMSLASSLNLSYLDALSEAVGRNSADWAPVHNLLRDHRVGRYLKGRGYKYVHLGAGFDATHTNPNADVNRAAMDDASTFLIQSLFQQTSAYPAMSGGRWNLRFQHWVAAQFQLDALTHIPEDPAPTFTFAHILLPHDPYVFDRDGKFVPEAVANARSEEENYAEQLRYANTAILRVVDRILATPKLRPIILLQSDEGPFPERYRQDLEGFDWRAATRAELRQKTGILNAYYLPGFPSEKLYPTITPVNSFRLVFAHYFGSPLQPLPDRNYAYRDARHLYDFFEITERVGNPR